jgi:hypothetical protein
MDSVCQGSTVVIVRASNDSTMGRSLSVQSKKVPAIECQHGPSLRDGKREHIRVFDSFVRPAGIYGCQDIMAQFTKLLNNCLAKILVGMEVGHSD